MKMGFDLTIEQVQKMVMTPELIQAIQILQFNVQDLEQYVHEQLLENPVLEKDAEHREEKKEKEDPQWEEKEEPQRTSEKDEVDWKEIIRQKQYDDISYGHNNYKADDTEDHSFEGFVASEETLIDYLMPQLRMMTKDEHLLAAGEYIIENLDDNGYLIVPLDEVADATNECLDVAEHALSLVQDMDPVGVGARDIKECILIQLKSLGILTPEYETLVNEYFEDLGTNRIAPIAKALGIPKGEVQQMVDIIRTLEPKPGREYISSSGTRYIVPDVFVDKVEGQFVVHTNEGSVPHLSVSSYYSGLLNKAENDEELSSYLSDRINSAVWLIKSINQRKQTIYNVVSEVVKYQQDFFEKGPKYMKPMTLRVIADKLGVHESTVSRSINGKYMQCPLGVYEIRYFFSSGVQGDSGDDISSSSVKEFIKELVDGEDPAKPLSDQEMVGLLKEKGINISRRTIAKYRDEIGIPSSSRRRRY